MPNPEMRKKLWLLGMFVLPVVAVKVAAELLVGPAPSSAQGSSATPAPVAPVPAAENPIKWSERQVAAASHIQSLRGRPFGPTPFLQPVQPPTQPPPPVIDSTPEAAPTPVYSDLPHFALQAVMAGGRGKTAIINGRPYREGDRIRGSDWTVVSIDCTNRSVSLKDAQNDRTLTVNVEKTGS